MRRTAVSLFVVIVMFGCSDRNSPVSSESAGTPLGTAAPRPVAGKPVNFEEMAANYAQSVSQDAAVQGPVTGASSHECTFDVPLGTTTYEYTFGTGTDCNNHLSAAQAAFPTATSWRTAFSFSDADNPTYGTASQTSDIVGISYGLAIVGNDPVTYDMCLWSATNANTAANTRAACTGSNPPGIIRRITLRRPPLTSVTISGPTTVEADSRNQYTASAVGGISLSWAWFTEPDSTGSFDDATAATTTWTADTDEDEVILWAVATDSNGDRVPGSHTVTVNQPAYEVAVAGPTSLARHEEGTWTATLDPPADGPVRWQWRWYTGGARGRVIKGCNSATCSWTVRGFFRGEDVNPETSGDQVRIIPIATIGGVKFKPQGDARHDVTVTNTPPTLVNRMQVQPWPSFDGHTVSLITAVCDEDDPINFDPTTYRCGGSRRKWRSYLHSNSNYSWTSAEGGTIDVLGAPWQANFTPPEDAANGDVFTITATVTDPDGGSASVDITVEVRGKESAPEPVSTGNLAVELTPSTNSVRVGGGVTVTSAVSGDFTEPVSYAWTSTLTHDRSGRPTTVRPYPAGGFRYGDRPTARWVSYRPGTAKIEVTVTDANGVEATASVEITASLR